MTTEKERRKERAKVKKMWATAKILLDLAILSLGAFFASYVLLYTGITYFQRWPWRNYMVIEQCFGWKNGALASGNLGGVLLLICVMGLVIILPNIAGAIGALWIVYVKEPYERRKKRQQQLRPDELPESVKKFFLMRERNYDVTNED